ncbi:MAG: DUF2065 domain-containing protein [Thermodesulfobacteriota bacterium]
MTFFWSVIGVVLIIEGIPYFIFPGKVKNWAQFLQEIPERTLRVMGFASMGVGLVLLYVVRYLK